eukprot:COSAG02_NODE_67347_length_253_cov_0.668831_1_plen_21_part_01
MIVSLKLYAGSFERSTTNSEN